MFYVSRKLVLMSLVYVLTLNQQRHQSCDELDVHENRNEIFISIYFHDYNYKHPTLSLSKDVSPYFQLKIRRICVAPVS